MKILIIGHSVIDQINYKNKVQDLKPGGIFYSTAAFNSFKENDDEIYLLTSIEKKNYYLFGFVYDNIKQNYFQYVDNVPKIFLTVWDDKERQEQYENFAGKLKLQEINFNEYEGIFINMITGFDIDISDMELIRKNFNGLIYLDIHSLSRGVTENNIRNFRKIPDAVKWIQFADVIQANENEILTLSEMKNEFEIANEILSCGSKILLITKGENGVRLFTKDKREIYSQFYPSVKIETKNKIGCGDVFGAAFFYSYLKNKNIKDALLLANTAAGLTASFDNIKNILKLKEDVFSRYN